MKVPPAFINLRDGDGAPAYESMLDLFTMLSLILIIASFFFSNSASDVSRSKQAVHSYLAGRGSGLSATLPNKVILVVVAKESGVDKITIVKSGSSPVEHILETPIKFPFLAEWRDRFVEAEQVSITMLWRQDRPSALVLEELQRWFGSINCKYDVVFAGTGYAQ